MTLSNEQIEAKIETIKAHVAKQPDSEEQFEVVSAGLDLLSNFLQCVNDIAFVMVNREV